MKLSIVSFKECWQDDAGAWMSYGGFPAQMKAISSLFEETDLVICLGKRRAGGIALPPNVRVIPLRNPPGRGVVRKLAVLLRLPSYLAPISRSIRSADAVHTPVPGDIALLGMLGALFHRKRLVARYCGSWKETSTKTLAKSFTRALMARNVGGRNVMLATGAHEEPPAEGMRWIFTAAMTRGEAEAIKPDLDRMPRSPARLVFAGRLAPPKRVDHLLAALAKLRESGFTPLPFLTVLGDGPDRERLERLTRYLVLGSRVEFLGQVDREELSKQMLLADLYVHPSLSEGMCKAWVDALTHGLPVLTYDVGGAPMILGESGERGWFVPIGDVDGLVRKLREVLTSPLDWPGLRRRCREYGRKRTIESWGATIGAFCAESWGVELRDGKLREAR